MHTSAGQESHRARCEQPGLIEQSALAAHRNLFLDGCGPATGLANSWQAGGGLIAWWRRRQKIAEYLVP